MDHRPCYQVIGTFSRTSQRQYVYLHQSLKIKVKVIPKVKVVCYVKVTRSYGHYMGSGIWAIGPATK